MAFDCRTKFASGKNTIFMLPSRRSRAVPRDPATVSLKAEFITNVRNLFRKFFLDKAQMGVFFGFLSSFSFSILSLKKDLGNLDLS